MTNTLPNPRSADAASRDEAGESGADRWTVRPTTLLRGILIGALAVGLWPLWLALRAAQPVQAPILIAHVCGMLAGYGVAVLIGLMSRTPLLERGVGADLLARWHSRGGRLVVLLILVHAGAAVIAWRDSRQLNLWLATGQVLRLPYLIAATLATLLFLAVAVLSVRAARRRVSYETWHTIHLLVYLAVGLGFLHQLGGPDLAGYRVLQVLWALLFTSVFALLLQHRVLTPLRNATRHRMRVHSVIQQAPGVVSVIIEGSELHALRAQSGQFFRWRFLTPDLWKTAHPFSLSAPPTPQYLRLTVKALGDGSSRLQSLEPGTWVLAEGPYGAVTAARRTRRDVVLIAAGVGITPLRALFESIELSFGQDLLLLYRARSEADLIFRQELDALAWRPGARVQYLVGETAVRLSAATLGNLIPDLPSRDVYLCGPPGFATELRRELRTAGLPPRQLHEERFDF